MNTQAMIQRCATCGYKTSNSAFMRRERGGVLGLPKRVCMGCLAYQPSKAEVSESWRLVVGLACWAPLTYFLGELTGSPAATTAFMGAFFLSWPINIPLHELGHAIGARLAGLHVVYLSMGTGPLVWAGRLGPTKLEWRRYTFLGGATLFVDLHSTESRGRRAVGILGGPLANFICSGVLIAVAMRLSVGAEIDRPDIAIAFLSGLALSHGVSGVRNLIPSRSRRGLLSDGAQLMGLLKRRPTLEPALALTVFGLRCMNAGRFGEAAVQFKAAARIQTENPLNLGLALHCLSRTEGDGAAIRYYFENAATFAGAESATLADEKALLPWLYANIAWCAAKTGDRDRLELADNFARRAFETAPDVAEMKGTMGAVLIEQGEIESGYPLLLDAMQRIGDQIDRADFSRYLAKANRTMGEPSLAEDFENLRRRSLASAGIKPPPSTGSGPA